LKVFRFYQSYSWQTFLLLAIFLLVAFLLNLGLGALDISFGEVLGTLLGGSDNSLHHAIVLKIRLPRACLALLVGAALGTSGATFQAVLRNPLADPYLLGISGGAALGAVLALTFGFASNYSIPLAAFLGAMGALGSVYFVARAYRSSTQTLILSGVMIGSFASALLLFVLWSAPAEPTRAAIFWLAGDLANADLSLLPGVAVWITILFFLLWIQAPALDLFTQGEDAAADLGLAVGYSRFLLFLCAGALTSAAVALAGLVGFVGLVVPHVVRLLWGPNHRGLLPAAALVGGSFLVLADVISRIVFAPAEIPVGVVTALIGAPFFLYLLRKRERAL